MKYYDEVLNGCQEALQFLFDNYEYPEFGWVEFEGTKVEFTAMGTDYCSYTVISPKFPRTLFIIGEEFNDTFQVMILRNSGNIDELPCLLLPAYCRNQLIATAEGK